MKFWVIHGTLGSRIVPTYPVHAFFGDSFCHFQTNNRHLDICHNLLYICAALESDPMRCAVVFVLSQMRLHSADLR